MTTMLYSAYVGVCLQESSGPLLLQGLKHDKADPDILCSADYDLLWPVFSVGVITYIFVAECALHSFALMAQ